MAYLEIVHWGLLLVVMDTWHVVSAVGNYIVSSVAPFVSFSLVFGLHFWRRGGFRYSIFVPSCVVLEVSFG